MESRLVGGVAKIPNISSVMLPWHQSVSRTVGRPEVRFVVIVPIAKGVQSEPSNRN
jgi:hypothetical protein